MTPSTNSEISDDIPQEMINEAMDCENWPLWVHDIVDRVTGVDLDHDMSTEQVIGLALILSRRSANSAGGGVEVKAESLLAIRDALLADDLNEAYHQLYMIADPAFCEMEPWRNLEHKASLHPTEGAEPVVGKFVHHKSAIDALNDQFDADTRSSPVSAEVTVTDEMVERAARAIASTAYDGVYFSTRTREQYVDAEWRNHETDARTVLSSINGGRENG